MSFSRRSRAPKCSNLCRNQARTGRNDPYFATVPAIRFQQGTRPSPRRGLRPWKSKRRRTRPRATRRRPRSRLDQALAANAAWAKPKRKRAALSGGSQRNLTSKRRLRGRRGRSFGRRRSAVRGRRSSVSRGFSRSFGRGFRRRSRLFRRRRRLAAGRDAEGENGSSSSGYAHLDLRHRLLPLVSASGSTPNAGGDSMPRINRDGKRRSGAGSCISA